MSLHGKHDDTSSGAITQGGHRDEGAPGPARRSGKSYLWFAAALVVAVVLAVAWLGGGSHKSAPDERNLVEMTHAPSAAAGRSAGAPSP